MTYFCGHMDSAANELLRREVLFTRAVVVQVRVEQSGRDKAGSVGERERRKVVGESLPDQFAVRKYRNVLFELSCTGMCYLH